MKEFNVHEVLAVLQKYYITDSQQMVTRWIREGKLPGKRGDNRKEGYLVAEEDLFEFIEQQRPGLPSIMEVYEEYVKQIKTEDKDKYVHSNIPETETSQMRISEQNNNNVYDEHEIKKLKDQIIDLENMIMDLQEEIRVNDTGILELMEDNNSLQEKIKSLVEENNTYNELYVMIEEENEELKKIFKTKNVKCQENYSQSENEDVKTKTTRSFSFAEFKHQSESILSKLNIKLISEDIDNHLKQIYIRIFDDKGDVIKKQLSKDGCFKCPYTEKEYKQQKRLINNAIKYYFETLNNKNQGQVEMDLTIASN